ncbi:AAA family ATPase [Nostoc sp. 'Peltigera membranacea cyanobiont' N6]|uniref:AAA family ATPase n=1 Tax=Nostoc sp. 'Peltigera membranacea cyanobiont' N6 TaxID=1261031 RepID=UPI000CF317C6|nr:ATP-binding protein [Nostoc sp. 'Peltigera membranacea cyanobiont' N6]AVH67823.1 putative ATPase [Nostoc sp. 'Peltigera membranacea cyanobiont' N6]
MLKQLILENWKSFRYAELPLDPLTVLIGTNASGKSNVVEALEFLQRIARGENIEAALAGDKILSSIRGGVEWAAIKPEKEFTLKALVAGEDETTDYLYVIKIQTIPEIRVIEEYIEPQILSENYLNNINAKSWNFPTRSGLKEVNSPININEIMKFKKNLNNNPIEIDTQTEEFKNTYNEYAIFKQKIKDCIISKLENILILNPEPSKMRDYSRLSDTFESDASNIAGVLATLSDERKKEVESTLSTYVKDLPEGDSQKVWAEKVGRFRTDAMLYCQEHWKPGQDPTTIDAKTMSDGTLRFIAILTALLTRPEGSQLVIEEIDNGLHPSRAELLVRILREIGSKRKIDILLTTHNPALLDALGPEIVPFLVVAHRDSETGESKLTLLEDIDNFSKLFASYSLGDMTTKGAIERSLSHNE